MSPRSENAQDGARRGSGWGAMTYPGLDTPNHAQFFCPQRRFAMPRFTHPPHAQTDEERVQQTADDIVRGFGHRRLGHKQQYALRRMRINLLTGTPTFARYYPEQVVMRTLLGRELVLKIGTSSLPSWQEWSLTPLGDAVARRLEG